jgi:hypothetical protein
VSGAFHKLTNYSLPVVTVHGVRNVQNAAVFPDQMSRLNYTANRAIIQYALKISDIILCFSANSYLPAVGF